jgi:hypothetical protein
MSEVLERISETFLKILALFKTPSLERPEPVEIEKEEITIQDEERKYFTKNLGELLDHLDVSFDAYNISTTVLSGYLSRDEILGLKKLGAHVPNPWLMKYSDETPKITETKLPAMMFIGLALSPKDDNEFVHPDFMFAIKTKKFPWYVEKKDGTLYKFGMGYRLGRKNLQKQLIWQAAWLVVKQDGTIEFCKEGKQKQVVVGGGIYMQRARGHSDLYESVIDANPNEGEQVLRNFFVAMHDWWIGRNERWSVCVKKNGDRVTFAVDRSMTKRYFADRQKTVNQNGNPKRIFHYVKQFERVRNGKTEIVKEHLRGLNEFDWKGYHCLISAPEFHGLTSVDFNIGAEDSDDIDEKYISVSKVGLMLSRDEDERARKRQ